MRTNDRKRPRGSTTPIYDRSGKRSFARSFAAVILVPLTLYLTVMMFGLPSLRFQYTYYGTKEYRQYVSCDYLTINGFIRITPPLGVNQCGLIRLFPAF